MGGMAPHPVARLVRSTPAAARHPLVSAIANLFGLLGMQYGGS